MKNSFLILCVLFVGCSFDAYNAEPVVEYEDNVFYSVESDGIISGDLFYFDDSMKSKDISEVFEYSCRTLTPSIVFQSYGDDVTIKLMYNGVEYSDSGGGTLIITIP